jgi:RNA polymerase sigma factor (sigma-70 family)
MTGTGPTRVDDEYAALYREHNARLVAYARSLTGSSAVAEDLAAEAHFRVWRRIRAGHAVENPSAYLTTTVRNLAAGLGRAQREIARDVAELPEDPQRAETLAEDPERRASQVDLISRLLKELPERWAKALWYAEVEDLPMEAVGERIGASAGTTAVVLTRARERLRQAFLQSQHGRPANEECEQYWKQMPTIVRATASARRTKSVLDHCEGCDDCRTRMLALTEANTRLPLLLGPALLGIVLGGGAWFLPTVAGVGVGAAGAAVGAKTAGTAAARAGTRAGSGARHARLGAKARLVKHGVSPAKATVYGATAAAVGVAAVAAAMAPRASNPPSRTNTAAAQLRRPRLSRPRKAPPPRRLPPSRPRSRAPPRRPLPPEHRVVDTTGFGDRRRSELTAGNSGRDDGSDDEYEPCVRAAGSHADSRGHDHHPGRRDDRGRFPLRHHVIHAVRVGSPTLTTATPTPSLTPTPSQTPGSPTPSPTATAPSPPSCVVYFYGLCVIW